MNTLERFMANTSDEERAQALRVRNAHTEQTVATQRAKRRAKTVPLSEVEMLLDEAWMAGFITGKRFAAAEQ